MYEHQTLTALPIGDVRLTHHYANSTVCSVSTLLKGDFESFRLDTLVGFAVRCGHKISIDAA
jgi:hypothetical protein